MNISVPSSAGLSLLALVILVVWGLMLWRRKSTRARQWMLKSTLLGAVIGPVLVLALHPVSVRVLSWMPDQGLWLEFLILAGLCWGLAAAALKSLPFDHDYPQPVTIHWWRYVASIVVLVILALIVPGLPLASTLVMSAAFVMVAVLTSAWYPVRLINGLIGGVVMTVMLALLSIAATSIWTGLPRVLTLMQGVYFGAYWSVLVLAFCLGLAIPGLTAWWLGQPQRTVTPPQSTTP